MGLLPSANQHATTSDPNSTQRGRGRHGGSGAHSRRGEFGTVISYQSDRYTATVRTERGRTLTGVGRVRNAPGEVIPLSPGTEVLISHDYGLPVIMGVLAIPASSNAGSESFAVTDDTDALFVGGDGVNQGGITTHGNFRGAHEPRDVIPGDWVQMGEDGNVLGVLGGGVNVIKSSALCQIRTHLVNELVEIFSRNYRHITDMGEFSVTNDEGRVNMRFRGASDEATEASPEEENWTIKMDLGSEGDLFNFELCTPQGQTLFKLHVDSEGGAEIFGINGVALTSGSRAGGTNAQETSGSQQNTIGGDRTADVRGSDTLSVGTNQSIQITSDQETNIGNDYRIQALRDMALGSGRNVSVVVQGGEGDNALTFDVEDGNWVVDMGSATNQDSGINFKTFGGNMKFETQTGGDFEFESRTGNLKTTTNTAKIITGTPNSVVLGGDSLASNLVKFQELQSLLMSLFTKLDTHVHPAGAMVAAGTMAVTGMSAPPAVPIGAPLNGQIIQLKSVVAGVSS